MKRHWGMVMGMAVLLFGIFVSLTVDFRPRGHSRATKRATKSSSPTPAKPLIRRIQWQSPRSVDLWAFDLFGAPTFVADSATGRFELVQKPTPAIAVKSRRPMLRVIGIHREVLPIEFRGVTGNPGDSRGIFFLGSSLYPVFAGRGERLSLSGWQVEHLHLEKGEAPAALLTDVEAGRSVLLEVGKPFLAGEMVAWISGGPGDGSGDGYRCGDLIEDGPSAMVVDDISDGPDEAVTILCDGASYVFVPEEESPSIAASGKIVARLEKWDGDSSEGGREP